MQPQLLEQYITALHADPDAIPPAGLDPATAAFARKLVRETTLSHPSESVKARVWRRAYQNAQPSDKTLKETDLMTAITPSQPLPSRNLTLIAVAAIAVLIGAVLIVATNLQPPDGESIIPAAGQNQDDDPTAPATLMISATPVSLDAPMATVTPAPSIIASPVRPTIAPSGSPGAVIAPGQIPEGYIPVVSAYVNIRAGERIRADMLTVVYWPAQRAPSDVFSGLQQVVGQFATQDIDRFLPVFNYETAATFATITASATFTPSPTWTPTMTTTPTPTVITGTETPPGG
jgi:hypothetical protein